MMLLPSRIHKRLIHMTMKASVSQLQLEKPFLPHRALVLKKFSRIEYERLSNPQLSEESLAIKLKQQGSVYESLAHHDQIQRSCLKQIEAVLKSNNIEYQTVDRFSYTDERVEWADVIITSGGDGTFLMAASKVSNRNKPVIGINSDPTKSVGHLCLPSQYTHDFARVIDSLRTGNYSWFYRQRLRVTLTGDAALEAPKPLDDIRYSIKGHAIGCDDFHDSLTTPLITPEAQQTSCHPPQNSSVHPQQLPQSTLAKSTPEGSAPKVKQLRERVLNEVFFGELLSARVSYYDLSLDNRPPKKLKSSGLTVCTGTGSSSWYYNINKVSVQEVKAILDLSNKLTENETKIDTFDNDLMANITTEYNNRLIFPPTKSIMAYSIRDPVGYSPSNTGCDQRGTAQEIEIRSRMQNAYLVLDGCQYYPFNMGSFALVENRDEDALKTIHIPSQESQQDISGNQSSSKNS